MIEFLLLDLDDTVLDFRATEKKSIERIFRSAGIEPSEELLQRYREINWEHWHQLERGEITRDQISHRFDVLFGELGVAVSTQDCERMFRQFLSEGDDVLPGAAQALQSLSQKYRIFAAPNSTVSVQHGRLERTGLRPYFEDLFISEAIGAYKPSAAFFDHVFAAIPGFDPEKAIMVGDSLTSDIQGGNNAGIRTCWINPGHRPNPTEFQPHYEIEALPQLEALLESL